MAMDPPSRALQLFDAFGQDEIALIPARLFLTIGTRLERNYYTGFEVMPSVSASWSANDRNMVWVAVSRALRAPSRNDTNLVLNLAEFTGPGNIPTLLRLLGNPQFQDERVIAYEAGYRTMISKRVSIDLTAYFDDWVNVQTTEPSVSFFEAVPVPAHEVQTLTYENLMHGESHGVEIMANWKVRDRWSLSAGFAAQHVDMCTDPQSADTQTALFLDGGSPDSAVQLRSHFDVSGSLSWDVSKYYVGALENQGPLSNVTIPSYARMDSGLTWRVGEGVSIGVAGQNLLKDHHLDFEDMNGSLQSGEIKRSGYAKITWRF